MKRIKTCATLGILIGLVSSAQAAKLQEFLFDDPLGTTIENTANSVTTLQWSGDSAGDDLPNVTTNGSGQYDLTLKDNDGLGTVFLDIPDITTGTVYGVMELTWDFDTATLNTAENEIIRLSLIDSPDLGSSFVTAEVDITREDDNIVRIFGNGIGTGAADTAEAVINSTQTQLFIAVLAVNLDTDQLAVSYSADGGTTFSTLTGGALDPARTAQQVRMYMNNDFSDDSMLIDRVALYDTNPFPGQIPSIPEPASLGLFAMGLFSLAAGRWLRK